MDVIGDVHGEVGALLSLLDRLGYDGMARHPEGRRLVFLGDLVDRGPDSMGVVRRVADWVGSGRAQCVLGNHELNLLRGKRKQGNHWFFGDVEAMEAPDGEEIPQPSMQGLASAADQAFLMDFFRTLPLALERDDLRVVHAAWVPDAIESARALTGGVREAFDRYVDQARRAVQDLEPDLEPHEREVQAIVLHQNLNPIKVLTSGLETGPVPPFYAGGKMRRTERVAWWEEYDDSCCVVFGHYWRHLPPSPQVRDRPGLIHPRDKTGITDLFGSHGPYDWLGRGGTATCIDFSVGKRFYERLNGLREGDSGCALGALRWTPGQPSELLLDTGHRVALGPSRP